jgi:hypothetical protein
MLSVPSSAFFSNDSCALLAQAAHVDMHVAVDALVITIRSLPRTLQIRRRSGRHPLLGGYSEALDCRFQLSCIHLRDAVKALPEQCFGVMEFGR